MGQMHHGFEWKKQKAKEVEVLYKISKSHELTKRACVNLDTEVKLWLGKGKGEKSVSKGKEE